MVAELMNRWCAASNEYSRHHPKPYPTSALEATQGPMDGLFSQLPYKCHLEEVDRRGGICGRLT